MALAEGLDLSAALREVRDRGAAYLTGALDERFRRRLRREVASGPFVRFPGSFGEVRQEIDAYDVLGAMEGFPALAELRDELARLVRAHGRAVRGLASWLPNEAGVARYPLGSLGITPHLDGKRYRRLVAVITVYGTARFAVCRNRAGEVERAWDAGPGSLTLLGGPGLGGVRDGRRFHRVSGPRRGERCSIGYRMNVG